MNVKERFLKALIKTRINCEAYLENKKNKKYKEFKKIAKRLKKDQKAN